MNWETVCLNYFLHSETFPNSDKLVAEFKKYLESDAWLKSWFDSKNGTFATNNFSGTCHCEAIVSILMYLQCQDSMKLLLVCYLV